MFDPHTLYNVNITSKIKGDILTKILRKHSLCTLQEQRTEGNIY